jgi:hypothetical protein
MSYTHPGRPTELDDETLKKIEVLYCYNVPATRTARYLKLSRQRVYYYYKKLKFQGIEQKPALTPDKILARETDTLQEVCA